MKKIQSLKSMIYCAILEGIIKDEYKPNQIISEKELVEKHGISKSPVREALVELCNEGVLRSLPRLGYEVIRLTRTDVDNILNFRLILESGYLKKCYQNLTTAQLDHLDQLNELCITKSLSDDMWIHWEHNKNFHLQLLSYANNEFAYSQLKKSLDILTRAYAQFYWDKWDSSYFPSDMKSHSKIINSLRNSNIDAALSYLELDLKDFGF